MFLLSKVLEFLVLPSNAMVLAALAGLALMASARTARAGFAVTAAAVALLIAFGFLPFGRLLMLPLEQRFPAFDPGRGDPDGIVVLGGVIEAEAADRPGSGSGTESGINEAAERLTVVADLARRYPGAKILFSGGDILMRSGTNEAHAAGALFQSFGIPANRLMLEGRSRTTAENAKFSRGMAMPAPGEHWLLVTSAWHMPRAVGAFRKAGFPVEAYPVDYRTAGAGGLFVPFGSVSIGLRRTDVAAREWLGLAGYWATGRSSALFPAP